MLLSFLESLFAPFGFDAHCSAFASALGPRARGGEIGERGDWGAGWYPALAALPACLTVGSSASLPMLMPFCWLTGA